MAPPPQAKQRTRCVRCTRELTLLPGDASTECKSREHCDDRRAAHPNPPPLVSDLPTTTTAPPPCEHAPQASTDPGDPKELAQGQRALAVRALQVTQKVMDKIESALNNGVEMTLKDGTKAMQQVQPMALASILRELRPVVQEPIRAAEAKDENSRPLFDGRVFADPAVVAVAVAALHSRRDRLRLAADRTIAVQPTEIEENVT